MLLSSCSDEKAPSYNSELLVNCSDNGFAVCSEDLVFYTDSFKVGFYHLSEGIETSQVAIRDPFYKTEENNIIGLFSKNKDVYYLMDNSDGYEVRVIHTGDFSSEVIYTDTYQKDIDENKFMGISVSYYTRPEDIDRLNCFWIDGHNLWLLYDSGVYSYSLKSKEKKLVISQSIYNKCISYYGGYIFYVDNSLNLHRYTIKTDTDYVFENIAVTNIAILSDRIFYIDACGGLIYKTDFYGENTRQITDHTAVSISLTDDYLLYVDEYLNLHSLNLETSKEKLISDNAEKVCAVTDTKVIYAFFTNDRYEFAECDLE